MCNVDKKKYLSVERIYLKHDNLVHEFVTNTSPFVCRTCSSGNSCPEYDGNSEKPIDISKYNKFQKQYKYESVHFYGEGYGIDLISIEIRIINSYSFTILISRESPFNEMPLDFHEVVSSTTLTPKFIHQELLDKLVFSVKNIQIIQKLLEVRRDDDFRNIGSSFPNIGVY